MAPRAVTVLRRLEFADSESILITYSQMYIRLHKNRIFDSSPKVRDPGGTPVRQSPQLDDSDVVREASRSGLLSGENGQ